jgi:peptide deformylase
MDSLGAVPDEPFDLEAWLASPVQPPPIVQAGATVLRRRALDVPGERLGSTALLRLVEVMVDVMRDAPGVGLAAPQIGVPLRVFVAEDPEERLAQVSSDARELRARTPLPLIALINPTVTPVAGSVATFFEGCLSVRGYGALVTRAAAVTVEGVDLRGRPLALRLEGWPARIMQHEMDHLNGTLYVDRMISRSLACDAELGRLGALPVSEVLRQLGVPPSRNGDERNTKPSEP